MASGRQWVIGVLAFLRKELVGVVRQPILVLTLVVGPFLILLLFGAGLVDEAPPVRTVFVAPAGSEVADEAEEFSQRRDTRLLIEGVTADLDGALRRVSDGDIDLVVEFPADVDTALSQSRRPAIVFYHDYLDPIEAQAMIASMRTAVDEVNQQVAQSLVRQAQQDAGDLRAGIAGVSARVSALRAAVQGGNADEVRQQLTLLRGEVAGLEPELDPDAPQRSDPSAEPGRQDTALEAVESLADQMEQLAEGGNLPTEASTPLSELAGELERLQAGLDEFGRLPPGLFVSPFRGVAERVVDGPVDLTDFYTPAVLVLLAQHLAVTFLGLSVVRDEQLGTTELFRAAPVSAGQILAGKCLAYLLLSGTVTALLTALVVGGLGVPMRGSWWLLLATALIVLVASTGLGYVFALLASSATQAVQYAMMLLLANVFFTGFLLALERFAFPVRAVPWLLPATYGVALFRDVMLRGAAPSAVLLGVLALIAVGLLAVSWLLLRRRLLRS